MIITQHITNKNALGKLSTDRERISDTLPKWDASLTYAQYDIISHLGVIYESLQNSNFNKDPVTETSWWSATEHSHSNKSTLDNITAAYTTAEQSKLTGIEPSAKDDQNASEVPFTPSGTISASNVQDAIAEVRDDTITDLAGKSDTSHNHDADYSNVPDAPSTPVSDTEYNLKITSAGAKSWTPDTGGGGSGGGALGASGIILAGETEGAITVSGVYSIAVTNGYGSNSTQRAVRTKMVSNDGNNTTVTAVIDSIYTEDIEFMTVLAND